MDVFRFFELHAMKIQIYECGAAPVHVLPTRLNTTAKALASSRQGTSTSGTGVAEFDYYRPRD
jgi:hypothetical protein